ncbi:MAG: hypothetical protein AAF141_12355 [Pseudomonadota bacterium]
MIQVPAIVGALMAMVAQAAASQHDFAAQERLAELPTAVDVFRKACLDTAPDFEKLDLALETLNIEPDEGGDQVVLAHAIDAPTNMYGWRRALSERGPDQKAGGDIIVQYVEGHMADAPALGCLVFGSGYSGLEAEDNLLLLLNRGTFAGESPAPIHHFGREGTNRQWTFSKAKRLGGANGPVSGTLTITNFVGFGGPDSSQITLELEQPDATNTSNTN